jgi:hypothetical protein
MSEKEQEKKQEKCGCGCQFSTGKDTKTAKPEDKKTE